MLRCAKGGTEPSLLRALLLKKQLHVFNGLRIATALVLGSVAAFEAASAEEQGAQTRNVILFVGDGMGVSTVTATRIFAGQQRGEPGEENTLSFEQFPHVALVKTYNVDAQVPDSAGTMTALVTGHKTRAGVLSVGPDVLRGDCATSKRHELTTLLEEAERHGLKTGLVTTARLTHATPAAAYAHSPERSWEMTAAIPEAARELCTDIARQLVEFAIGDGVDVALGGGRAMFLPTEVADPEDEDATGLRRDGRNLVDQWLAGGEHRRVVYDQAGFDALQAGGQTLGLFERSHMEYEADRATDAGGEPSLAAMTRFAIESLTGRSGYFLVVEGGRIDHAHHAGNAYRALVDAVALADAVAVAQELTDPDNTLIVVTADHSHTLTIAGYPARGNPILGFAGGGDGRRLTDAAGIPYTTLGYANGPGARRPEEELAPTDPAYLQRAAHPMAAETHSGEDVAAYALGVGSAGIGGVMDQHELHGVMRAALFGGIEAAAPAQTP